MKIFHHHLQLLTRVAADLDTSFMTTNNIIAACERSQTQSNAAMASFYLSMGEEARRMLADLELAHQRFFQEAARWPPPPDIQALLATLSGSARRVQNFLGSVREQELLRTQEEEKLKENGTHDTGAEAPLVPLA